jgi:endonuclease/exonuclease/phosphatase family metal-dependent hydrolase
MKVFSRLPILSQRPVEGVRENSRGGRQPLRFELQTGSRPLVLYALHPEPPRRHWQWLDRNLYLAGVAREVARDRATADVIAAGDFNTALASPFFRRLLADSGLVATGDGAPWEPTRFTLKLYPPVLLGATIDHVLVSDHFGVAARRTGEAFGSDHLPVAVDLGLNGQQAETPAPFVQGGCGHS